MLTVKMKKLLLVIARTDFENVLRVLIDMSCVEVTPPGELLGFDVNNTDNRLALETAELGMYGANIENIPLLGTRKVLILTGWMPAPSEQRLISSLSEYICAWEIENPSPDENEDIPLKLRWPKLLKIFFKNAGKLFNPLASARASSDRDQKTEEPKGDG
ncbi:MAG: hypothetical protein FWH57_00810 [Oscillospiraceae bacterium]|nr:hypothetical protein [Oscillospiraceae bacterium]